MKIELFNKLKKDYPDLLSEITEIYDCDGWYEILDSTSNLITNAKQYLKFKPVHYKQVKQKMGNLVIYHDSNNDFVNGVIAMAEDIAAKACEECGAKGQLYNTKPAIKTLCNPCAIRLEYDFIPNNI